MLKTKRRNKITLKAADEVERMRAAGRLVYQVLKLCHEICKPGISTVEIDRQACEVYTNAGAIGLFKNYPSSTTGVPPFPGNLCISLNDEVVHGIPSEDVIVKDGDIVSIDCGVLLDGWCGDSATTILVGNVDAKTRKLCDATRHVLDLAIQNIKPGRKWSQIARLMQNYAERSGYGVVKNFVGHGVGQELHEEPQVPNYYD
ncbi:MAG: type I methionyl aminopeptidase, partial [Phycisphaeraceae bacterium]